MSATQMVFPDTPTREDELQREARQGWRENPAFVAEIVRLAREDRRLHPQQKLSMGELFVVACRNLRQIGVKVTPNHNWRKPWSAFVMLEFADLDGAFSTRKTNSDVIPARGDS